MFRWTTLLTKFRIVSLVLKIRTNNKKTEVKLYKNKMNIED